MSSHTNHDEANIDKIILGDQEVLKSDLLSGVIDENTFHTEVVSILLECCVNECNHVADFVRKGMPSLNYRLTQSNNKNRKLKTLVKEVR